MHAHLLKTPTWLQKIGSKEMETSRFPEIQGNSRPLCESYMCINKKVCIIILYKYYMPCHHKITLNSSNKKKTTEITELVPRSQTGHDLSKEILCIECTLPGELLSLWEVLCIVRGY